jgi:hypothetical protein
MSLQREDWEFTPWYLPLEAFVAVLEENSDFRVTAPNPPRTPHCGPGLAEWRSACLCAYVTHRLWLGTLIARHNDPRGDVSQHTDSRRERYSQPDHSYQDYIHAQVACETGADTGDFLVPLVEHERLAATDLVADSGPCAATAAEAVVFAAFVAASCAEHEASAENIRKTL